MNLLESPCRECPIDRQDEDKDACCWTCKILRTWQLLDDPHLVRKRRKAVMKEIDSEVRKCPICGGLLVVEDGQLYCKKCLNCFLRDPEYDFSPSQTFSPFIARKLLSKYGWPVGQVAKMMRITEKYLVNWMKGHDRRGRV